MDRGGGGVEMNECVADVTNDVLIFCQVELFVGKAETNEDSLF